VSTLAPQPASVPSCPHCSTALAALPDRCSRCAGDLRPLARIVDLADRRFNDGLAAARRRRWREAAEHLAVTLALRPDDAGAWLLLGKVRFRQHDRVAARAAIEQALRIAPDHADALAALQRLAAPPRRRGAAR
jgi:tetratricopeptide (TPR) repeat protein